MLLSQKLEKNYWMSQSFYVKLPMSMEDDLIRLDFQLLTDNQNGRYLATFFFFGGGGSGLFFFQNSLETWYM